MLLEDGVSTYTWYVYRSGMVAGISSVSRFQAFLFGKVLINQIRFSFHATIADALDPVLCPHDAGLDDPS